MTMTMTMTVSWPGALWQRSLRVVRPRVVDVDGEGEDGAVMGKVNVNALIVRKREGGGVVKVVKVQYGSPGTRRGTGRVQIS